MKKKFNTRSVHEGQEPNDKFGSVSPPIYQTSTYRQKDIDNFSNSFNKKDYAFNPFYTQYNSYEMEYSIDDNLVKINYTKFGLIEIKKTTLEQSLVPVYLCSFSAKPIPEPPFKAPPDAAQAEALVSLQSPQSLM